MKDEITKILEEKKVENISVIDVRVKSALFDYFIIGTIESSKQVDAIIHELKQSAIQIHHIEESKEGDWVLIDCFDLIIHLFTEQKRSEYDLESLWKDTVKTLNK